MATATINTETTAKKTATMTMAERGSGTTKMIAATDSYLSSLAAAATTTTTGTNDSMTTTTTIMTTEATTTMADLTADTAITMVEPLPSKSDRSESTLTKAETAAVDMFRPSLRSILYKSHTADRNSKRICLLTLRRILDNIIVAHDHDHENANANADNADVVVDDEKGTSKSKTKKSKVDNVHAKKRRVKLENKIFKERVGRIEGGVIFLLACRFKYQYENGINSAPTMVKLFTQDEDVNWLKVGRAALDGALEELDRNDIGGCQDGSSGGSVGVDGRKCDGNRNICEKEVAHVRNDVTVSEKRMDETNVEKKIEMDTVKSDIVPNESNEFEKETTKMTMVVEKDKANEVIKIGTGNDGKENETNVTSTDSKRKESDKNDYRSGVEIQFRPEQMDAREVAATGSRKRGDTVAPQNGLVDCSNENDKTCIDTHLSRIENMGPKLESIAQETVKLTAVETRVIPDGRLPNHADEAAAKVLAAAAEAEEEKKKEEEKVKKEEKTYKSSLNDTKKREKREMDASKLAHLSNESSVQHSPARAENRNIRRGVDGASTECCSLSPPTKPKKRPTTGSSLLRRLKIDDDVDLDDLIDECLGNKSSSVNDGGDNACVLGGAGTSRGGKVDAVIGWESTRKLNQTVKFDALDSMVDEYDESEEEKKEGREQNSGHCHYSSEMKLSSFLSSASSHADRSSPDPNGDWDDRSSLDELRLGKTKRMTPSRSEQELMTAERQSVSSQSSREADRDLSSGGAMDDTDEHVVNKERNKADERERTARGRTTEEDAAAFGMLDKALEDMEFPPRVTTLDAALVRKGLKLCIAATVGVLRADTAAAASSGRMDVDIGNERINGGDDDDDDDGSEFGKEGIHDVPNIPSAEPEVAYLLWSSVLRIEEEMTRRMDKDGAKLPPSDAPPFAGAILRASLNMTQGAGVENAADIDPDVNDEGERMVLEVTACRFVQSKLSELGLIQECEGNVGDGSGGGIAVKLLSVPRALHIRYGDHIAATEFRSSGTAGCGKGGEVGEDCLGTPPMKRPAAAAVQASWTLRLAEALRGRVDLTTDGTNAQGRYAAFCLPSLYLRANRVDNAERLLTDSVYLRFRYRTLGPAEGVRRTAGDCVELVQTWGGTNLNISGGDCSGGRYEGPTAVMGGKKSCSTPAAASSRADRARKTAHTSYKFSSLHLRQNAALADPETHEGRALLDESGRALHSLASAFAVLGESKDELECYGEALVLKKKALAPVQSEGESIADTLHCMGSYHQLRGETFEAMTCYDRALRIYRSVFKKGEKLSVSRTLHNLGVIYCERREFDVAVDCFEQSLRIRQVVLGKRDISCADSMCWIGRVHRERGALRSALECFLAAYCTKEAVLGKIHLDVAEALRNIGVVYDDMGEHERSLTYYKRCLHIRRIRLGDEHENVAEILTCIANVYRAMEEYEMALNYFKIALRLRESSPNGTNKFVLLKSGDGEDFRSLMRNYEDVLELAKRRLENNAGDQELHSYIGVLLHHMGNLYDRVDEYTKSIEFYVKSLQVRKITKDHKSLGTLLNVMGISHAKRRHYRKAMKCFQDALLMRKATLGDHHLDVAETLHNVGNCCAKQGRWDKAMTSYKEALEIKRAVLGKNSVSAMKTLHNMGTVYEQIKEYDEALTCFEDALAVRKTHLGYDHIDVAFSLHSIGKIHKRKRNFEKAMEYFQSSLSIKKSQLGRHHLSTAETLHDMALIYEEGGKRDEAQNCLATALSLYESKLGENLCTADVLESYGIMYESRGEDAHALEYYERAREMKERILGEDHIAVSDARYRIGKVQERQGNYDGVLVSFKEVMKVRKRIHGKESLGVAAVLNDVGVIQLRRNELDVADRCFSEALRIWNILLGADHEYIGETLINLGELKNVRGDHSHAVERFAEAMNIFKEKRGADHLSVAMAYHKMGMSLAAMKDYVKATEAYQNCLFIRDKKLIKDSIQIAEVLGDLGITYYMSNEIDKARESLGESMRIRKQLGRDNDVSASDVMFYLGRVMVKMKYYDEALIYFEDALKLRKACLDEKSLGVSDVYLEIGNIQELKRMYKESLGSYEKCLRLRKTHLGDHELVADVYHCIGAVQQILHEHDMALKSFGSALSLYKTLLGPEHVSVAKAMNNIGLIYDAKNDLHLAMKYHKEAHRLRRLNLGDDHLKVASSLDNIAGLYQRQKNNEKALKCLKEALRIRSQKLGKDHLEVGTTLFGMGIVFCDIGDHDKAMECYNASLNIRKRKLGKSTVEVAQTLHNMGSVYALKCEYDKALEHWRTSLEKYREAGLSDDDHMMACTLGNIQMAENLLQEKSQDQ